MYLLSAQTADQVTSTEHYVLSSSGCEDQKWRLTQSPSAVMFLIMKHANQPVGHLIQIMCVGVRCDLLTKWGGGSRGSLRQRGPVFPQMPVWPQRSSRRRRRAERRDTSHPAESIPLQWTGKGIRPFSSLGVTLRPSCICVLQGPALIPPQVTANQHASPGTEPGLTPAAPPFLRISTSHLIATPLCFPFSSFIFLPRLTLWRLVTSWQPLKALIDSPVGVFVFAVQSHTVRLSGLFLLDTSSYTTTTLSTLRGNLFSYNISYI